VCFSYIVKYCSSSVGVVQVACRTILSSVLQIPTVVAIVPGVGRVGPFLGLLVWLILSASAACLEWVSVS